MHRFGGFGARAGIALMLLALPALAVDTHFTGGGDGINWTSVNNWDNGQPTNNSFNVFIDQGGAFSVQLNADRTINGLTIGGDDSLSLLNGSFLTFDGSLLNDGTLAVNAGGSATRLVFHGGAIGGAGKIVLNGANAQISGSGTMTQQVGHIISGFGSIGLNVVSLINAGVIDADSAGNALVLDPANTGAALTNSGTLRASNGGLLQLTGSGGGGFHNTGGSILATGAGSEVQLFSSAAIDGGTLSTAEGGVIRNATNQSAFLSNLTNAGTFIGNNNSTTHIAGTMTNNGSMTLAASVSQTDLAVDGDTLLTGNGTLVLSSVDANNNARVVGSGILTNDVNHVIQGQGQLGANVIGIINNGLVDANVTGKALVIDPANTPTAMINGGTLRASNGGLLQLTGSGGGGFHNDGGNILATGADSEVQLFSSAAIDGGTLTTAEGGVIRNATNQSAFLSNLTIAGTLIADNNSTTHIAGTITNNGSMTLAASSSTTGLAVDGDTLLTGSGVLTLSSLNTQSNARVIGSGTLTNDTGHIIQGQGQLGTNTVSMINNGLVDANISGKALWVDPANVATGLINVGTMRASNGGILQLTGSGGGGFHNDGGTILATGAGSEVQLYNSAAIDGGTLATADGGVIRNDTDEAAYLRDLTNAGTFIGNNNSTTHIAGTITNNGTMTVNAGVSTTNLNVDTAATLAGSGSVTLSGANARVVGTGMLTNTAGHTIQGQGNLGVNTIALVNEGLIDANVTGAGLVVDPANVPTGVTNASTMRASNGGLLQFTGSAGGGFHNDGGTILATGAGSEVQLFSSATIDGGTLSTADGGVIRNATNEAAYLRDLTNAGTFIGNNNSTTHIAGTITNNGTMTINAGASTTSLNVDTAATLTGSGSVTLSGVNARVAGTGMLTNTAGHTIQGQGNLGVNTVALVNEGLIDANVTGAGLVVDPSTVPTGVTNTSTMRASNGGLLQFTGSAGGGFHNDGGTILATGAGSEVQLYNGTAIDGGILTTADGGVIRNATNEAAYLRDLTNAGTFIGNNNSTTHIAGTITNNGTMTINAGVSTTNLNVDTAATLAGSGSVTLSGANARVVGTGTLTNAAGHTIQGQGNLGANTIALVNEGLIDANVNGAVLVLDPSITSTGVTNNAVLEASDSGIMQLTGSAGGAFTNNGIMQALDGSTIQTINGGVVTNNIAGTLTGGTYRSVSTGNAASVALNGPGISTIAANTTVELSGATATMTFGGTNLQSSLATNNGTLKVHDGHTFSMANALTNNGLVRLGGTDLADAVLNSGGNITNSATGEVAGHGTIEDTIFNSGLVRAAGGTLTMHGLIDGQSGTIQIDPGASLDLSGAGGDSDADFLTHNGVNLNLGANNVLVRKDYTNAGFGTGNSFNGRANVTGTGLILADPAVAQALNGDVSGGTGAGPSMDFGNIRVGDSATKSYAVNNVGAAGPVLRGALQTDNTAGNGGNITDSRLTGSGVTAQNYGVLGNNSASGSFDVTFASTSAGALTGQQVAIVNNFDNVADQTLTITGAAYNPAVARIAPSAINLGNFHVGDVVPGQAISISNAAPAGPYSEDLRAQNIMANPDAVLGAGSPSAVDVLAGATNTEVSVSIGTATAGSKTGKVTMDLMSNATVGGVSIPGLSPLSLGQGEVKVNATVYRLGVPSVATPVDLGEFHVGGLAVGSAVVGNTAVNDGYSESIKAQIASFSPDIIAASGTATVAPGGNSGGSLTAQISTATAGAKSGTVSIKLGSLAAAAGLADTDLGSQNAAFTAKVYNLAAPVVNNIQPIDFGIIHVGDTVSTALSITNGAAGGGFSENLNASFGTPDSGITTNGGSISLLTAQAVDSISMAIAVNTLTNRIVSGRVPISLQSDGTGVNSLGRTDLGIQSVNVQAQVNSYADALFSMISGDGNFIMNSVTDYSLDLGTVMQNAADPTTMLSLLNDVHGPADDLAGSYVLTASGFALSGFEDFSGLTAGSSIADLSVALNTANLGQMTGTITLTPRSENASGFSGFQPDILIHLSGEVVPEPCCLALCLLSAGILLGRAKGRRR